MVNQWNIQQVWRTSTMNEFEMDESDLLFGSTSDCVDEYHDDEEDTESESPNEVEDNDVSERRDNRALSKMMTIPSRHASVATTPPLLLRSRSMPSVNFLASNEQKWRVKYLSALQTKAATTENSGTETSTSSSPESSQVPGRSRLMSSGPIEIPQRASFDESSPGGAFPQDKSDDARYQRNLDQYHVQAQHEFVPPHQMVERDCFSLGMKHYFRPKVGNI
ncbi:unnamed protein product [Aphanomyces euteiches]|nr:hypothetical protein AeRB84_014823 [Aphanomyces euteiches]